MLIRDHVKLEELQFLKTELCIKENGLLKKVKKTEEVFKSGQMDLDTMVSGEMEWLMDMDVLFMQKEMSMRENGQRIRPTALVFIPTIMVVDTKVNGFRISSMDMVLSNGPMALNMRANMNKA